MLKRFEALELCHLNTMLLNNNTFQLPRALHFRMTRSLYLILLLLWWYNTNNYLPCSCQHGKKKFCAHTLYLKVAFCGYCFVLQDTDLTRSRQLLYVQCLQKLQEQYDTYDSVETLDIPTDFCENKFTNSAAARKKNIFGDKKK